jgi:hypothetical protein
LAAVLDAKRLEVPARKLELVVYDEAWVSAGDPVFSLNLNTGDGSTSADYDADRVPAFWFVLDVAIAREHAVAVTGPPAAEVFAPPAEERVREAVSEAMAWQRSNPDTTGAVLAACRAWHHRVTGTWISKPAAADWAGARLRHGDGELAAMIVHAAAAQIGGPGPDVPRETLHRLIARALGV